MSGQAQTDEVNALYRERIQLVAGYTYPWPSVVTAASDCQGWWIVYIESVAGQLSWHFREEDADLFSHVQRRPAWPWDGHTTEEKYRRLMLACRLKALEQATVSPRPAAELAAARNGNEVQDQSGPPPVPRP